MTADGTVKLTDFGLARSIASRLSLEGMIVGTVYYLAPEMAMGKLVDSRTDLYSLGVLLYEMTTGRLPFLGDDPLGVVSQHLYSPVSPPRAHRNDLPVFMDELIVKLLSKDPDERLPSARDVIKILDHRKGHEEPISPPATLLDRVSRGKLVGREDEIRQMEMFWRQTDHNTSQVLLITGESGIGKTRLVRELSALVNISEGKVLAGECYAEGGMPFEPFAQMIQATVDDTCFQNLDLPDFVISNLVTIAPALQLCYPDIRPVKRFESPTEQNLLFESILIWISTLATRYPLLLFIDDTHWADSATLSLVRYITRRTRNRAVLFVLAYREAELDVSGSLEKLLSDLNRDRLTTRIKLTRFDKQKTHQLIKTMLNSTFDLDHQLIDRIYQETEGNPFYIEEVCKSLVEDGQLVFDEGLWKVKNIDQIVIPQSLRLTVQSRLSRLPEQTQDMLKVAAIFGREFEFDILKHAFPIDEDQLLNALEIAEKAQIISELPHRESHFVFEHALIPSSLRESLNTLRRQRLHRKAASAIEREKPDDFETLAFHYEQAGDVENARRHYTRAAERDLRIYAFQEAETHSRAALELCKTDADFAQLYELLGESQFGQSKFEQAESTWKNAIQTLKHLGNTDKMAHVYSRSARAAWYAGDEKRGLATCREGMLNLPENINTAGTAGAAMLIHETARACVFNDLQDEALALCNKALQLAEKLGLVEVQAETLATLGILPDQSDDLVIKNLEKSISISESSGLHYTAARAHTNLSSHLHSRGDLEGALAHVDRCYILAKQLGLGLIEYFALLQSVTIKMEMGDLNTAKEMLPRLQELAITSATSESSRFEIDLLKIMILRHQGKLRDSIQMFEAFLQQISPDKYPDTVFEVNVELAELYLEIGETHHAEKILDSIQPRQTHSKLGDGIKLSALKAIVFTRVHQVEKAREELYNSWKLIEGTTYPSMKAWLLVGEVQVSLALEQWDTALDLIKKATDLSHQYKHKFFQAYLHRIGSSIYLARGKPGDLALAEQNLQEGLSIYKKIPSPGYEDILEAEIQKIRALQTQLEYRASPARTNPSS